MMSVESVCCQKIAWQLCLEIQILGPTCTRTPSLLISDVGSVFALAHPTLPPSTLNIDSGSSSLRRKPTWDLYLISGCDEQVRPLPLNYYFVIHRIINGRTHSP